MADNTSHIDKLLEGVQQWNEWREKNILVKPNLQRAQLIEAYLPDAKLSDATLDYAQLGGAYLHRANLWNSSLIGADLQIALLRDATLYAADLTEATLFNADMNYARCSEAKFINANLERAGLEYADLSNADLSGANLRKAHLVRADLTNANLTNADLTGARLDGARLINTTLRNATLRDCGVYGVSTWNLDLTGVKQSNLMIYPNERNTRITCDDIEMAQFLFLILENQKLRKVIDTITSKVVLILGSFAPDRKPILDAIRDKLKDYGYVPVMFDFEKPLNRNFIETVHTLAHMSRFIIADVTDPVSVPHELAMIIPTLTVPVQMVKQQSKPSWSMRRDFQKYPWVLPEYQYKDLASLLNEFEKSIIDPVDQWFRTA